MCAPFLSLRLRLVSFPRLGFVYSERGLWGLIMGQMTLGMSTSGPEQHFLTMSHSTVHVRPAFRVSNLASFPSFSMPDGTCRLKGRILGTVAGGVLGMVAWYAGNGHGNGNPYGMAASAAVFLVPIIFFRLYYPTPMEAIMTGVSAVQSQYAHCGLMKYLVV